MYLERNPQLVRIELQTPASFPACQWVILLRMVQQWMVEAPFGEFAEPRAEGTMEIEDM